MNEANFFDGVDDERVERLIAAVQDVCVRDGVLTPDGAVVLCAADLTAALLALLASVAETAPACQTRAGMRRTSEALGRELLTLMEETRALKDAGSRHHH